MARIAKYAKRHHEGIYERPSLKDRADALFHPKLYGNKNAANMKKNARIQRRQTNKSRRIGARKNRQANRQEFFSNIGTGQNIANFRQRKKSATNTDAVNPNAGANKTYCDPFVKGSCSE